MGILFLGTPSRKAKNGNAGWLEGTLKLCICKYMHTWGGGVLGGLAYRVLFIAWAKRLRDIRCG
jgi:hypothetical protein